VGCDGKPEAYRHVLRQSRVTFEIASERALGKSKRGQDTQE